MKYQHFDPLLYGPYSMDQSDLLTIFRVNQTVFSIVLKVDQSLKDILLSIDDQKATRK